MSHAESGIIDADPREIAIATNGRASSDSSSTNPSKSLCPSPRRIFDPCLYGESINSGSKWLSIIRGLGLSERERQIVQLLFAEHKDQSIAVQLGISYNTLRTQLSRLYRKLSVHTRSGVVVVVCNEAMRVISEERVAHEHEIDLKRK